MGIKVWLVWCPLILSAHCTLPQTCTQNPRRILHPIPCEGHESKLFPKARAGGTLGQLFYFCLQMVFPCPVGRAQLPINSPWPVPSFLTEDVKRGSTKQNQTSTARRGEKGNGCIKKSHWAWSCDELAQPVPICSKGAAFIFPPCSSESFSTGEWIGKIWECFPRKDLFCWIHWERESALTWSW